MTLSALSRSALKPSIIKSVTVCALALAVTACGATTPSAPIEVAPPPSPVVGPIPEPVVQPVELAERAYTPPHLKGQDITRIGLLLPFTASSNAARAEAARILRAAELALFERGDDTLLLMPKDTRGTPEGARQAASAAISDGAELILGPLFSPAVDAAGQIARAQDVPMLAFTTDTRVVGDGVFQLSFPPDEEVRRVTEFAALQGATRYGFIGPASQYGQVAHRAYQRTIDELIGKNPEPVEVEIELPIPEDLSEEELAEYEVETEMRWFEEGLVAATYYDGGISAMTEAAARLATIGVEELDPAEAARMTGLNWQPSLASPFQVVLLPEGGDELRMLAPVLLYEDIDPLLVKFIGTGLWREPDLLREPALSNGWFAGPDPEARSRFEAVYEGLFDEPPSRLAGLGYDATSLAALFAQEGVFTKERLMDPNGFVGVDGLFRFRENGTIERGLAVYTVRRGQFRVLDPAPARFDLIEEPDDVEPEEAF